MIRFDIHSELSSIQTGTHFWCSGCTSARFVSELSADRRYCRDCCAFLLKEAATLKIDRQLSKNAEWVPVVATVPAPAAKKALPATAAPAAPCDINPNGVSNKESAIGNIVTGNNQEGSGKEHRKRGRPRSARNALPLEKILELHQSGKSSRKIVEQLELEGLSANYRTVARALEES